MCLLLVGVVQQDAHRRGDTDGDSVARQQVDTLMNNEGHLESLIFSG